MSLFKHIEGPKKKRMKKLKILNIKKAQSLATARSIRLSEQTLDQKERANGFFGEVGDLVLFMKQIFKETFSRNFEFKEFLRQCYKIGNKSLPLIIITGTIMGLVLTIQSRPAMAKFIYFSGIWINHFFRFFSCLNKNVPFWSRHWYCRLL